MDQFDSGKVPLLRFYEQGTENREFHKEMGTFLTSCLLLRNGMNRTELNGTEQNRTEQNRTEQDRTEQNRILYMS
jgi:hypothetical protein